MKRFFTLKLKGIKNISAPKRVIFLYLLNVKHNFEFLELGYPIDLLS